MAMWALLTLPRYACAVCFFGNVARVYVLNALSACFICFRATHDLSYKVDKLDGA